jgi:hypothetical protein
MILHLNAVEPPESDSEAISYGVEITRTDSRTGDVHRIGWDGYVLLRELLESLIAEAGKNGWLNDVVL